MKDKKNNICLLSFDVEEWFQVENLKSEISKKDRLNIQELLKNIWLKTFQLKRQEAVKRIPESGKSIISSSSP